MIKPMITVIIPAYNAEAFIAETLLSVINQSWDNYEIILVDDGSSDHTAAIASTFPAVTVICQENRGVAAARNIAIAKARGDYIAFLDADDLWPPQKLSKQIEYMQQYPELGISYTLHQCFLDHSMDTMPLWVRPELFASQEAGYIPSALMVSREILQQVGLFNEHYQVSEDTEWLLRAKEKGIQIGLVPELLLHKRVHQDNLTGRPDVQQNLFRALADSISRRKKEGTKLHE